MLPRNFMVVTNTSTVCWYKCLKVAALSDSVSKSERRMTRSLWHQRKSGRYSMTSAQMQKANLIDYVEDTEQKIRIPTYQGHRVVVDNGMPVITGTPNKALVILFAPGAIGYASGQPDRAQEFERQAARGNGGGVDTLWSRRDVIMHPLGFSFLSS